MITNLGGNVFKLIRRYSGDPGGPPVPGIRVKTPPNQATVTFMRNGDHVRILRGSLMISKKELEKELGITWK